MDDQRRCLSTSLRGGRARGKALWARSQNTETLGSHIPPRRSNHDARLHDLVETRLQITPRLLTYVTCYFSLVPQRTFWRSLTVTRYKLTESAFVSLSATRPSYRWETAAILRSPVLTFFMELKSCCIVRMPPVLSQKISNNNNIKHCLPPHHHFPTSGEEMAQLDS